VEQGRLCDGRVSVCMSVPSIDSSNGSHGGFAADHPAGSIYTCGEVMPQNLWPRYDHHFVGVANAGSVALRADGGGLTQTYDESDWPVWRMSVRNQHTMNRTHVPCDAAGGIAIPTRAFQFANRFDSLCESIRFVKKSAFRFTSCHAVFALNK